MYRYSALSYTKMLLRRYQQHKREMQSMETVFKRIERIWNIKIDTDTCTIEDLEEATA